MMRSFSDLLIVVITLCGAVICGLNAAGLDLLCVTQGCSLYEGYSFLGISFYIYGLAGFAFIFILTLCRWRWNVEWLLAILVTLAITLDALFLVYQTVFWPCASCMVVAILLGLTTIACMVSFRSLRNTWFYGLFGIWTVFCIFVGLSVIKEVAVKPWAAYGSQEAPVKVYFSPTCPACKKVSLKILDDVRLVELAVFYPIAKNKEDQDRIAQFITDTVGGEGRQEALRQLFEKQQYDGPGLDLDAKMNLWMNKSIFASQGFTTVPMVVSPFVVESEPRFDPESFLNAVDGGDSQKPLWDPKDPGCGAAGGQDCE